MGVFGSSSGTEKQKKRHDNRKDTKKNKKVLNQNKNRLPKKGNDIGISMGLILEVTSDEDKNYKVSISSLPVGVSTGSGEKDFYVYVWFIRDTGEIFYVGKGRADRYKEYHERAYEAEKIRKMYDTGVRFVGTGLTEQQAIELESKEITRILNETNHRLTNHIIPFDTKRGNGYDRSPKTPKLQFETAPCFYASEIEEHYFGTKYRPFDEVEDENLKVVVFITRNIRNEINIIYGGKLGRYLDETKALLLKNGSKILNSKFAKSLTSWIYIGDDYVTNYENDQEKV